MTLKTTETKAGLAVVVGLGLGLVPPKPAAPLIRLRDA